MGVASTRTGPLRLALAVALGALAACGDSDAPDDELNPVRAPEIPRIVPAAEAIDGAHVATLDPATMVDAEIDKALGAGPRCTFRYTSSGKPVLAMTAPAGGDAARGVVKLNGSLVVLQPESLNGEVALAADAVRMTVAPDGGWQNPERREASAVFEVDGQLRVGYRGYYDCAGTP